jgi:hypothetical protein
MGSQVGLVGPRCGGEEIRFKSDADSSVGYRERLLSQPCNIPIHVSLAHGFRLVNADALRGAGPLPPRPLTPFSLSKAGAYRHSV